MTQQKPLAGTKVVELTTYVAAPTAGRILAEWGADVVKIESPAGDTWRYYGGSYRVPTTDDENPVFDIPNANKKSLVLDLKKPDALEILHKMLGEADVFITNTRVESLKKMELDYDSLKERYPRLVYALVTGYGEEGPDRTKPGFDTVAFWAAGGFVADMRIDEPGCYPMYSPAAVADLTCGTTLFGGICAALLARDRTGRGDKISISLYGTAVWTMGIMNTITQEVYGYKYPKKRYEGNPLAICYLCGDGEWIMLSAIMFEKNYPSVCKILGLEHMIDDPAYKDRASMLIPENSERLIKLFEKQFLTKPAAEWDRLLTEADIVHNLLNHFKDTTKNEQAIVNHFIDKVTFRSGTEAWLPRPSLRSENLGIPDYQQAPGFGQDSVEVLTAMGYSSQEVDRLMEEGAVIGN